MQGWELDVLLCYTIALTSCFPFFFAGFPGRLIPEDELESGWLDALD